MSASLRAGQATLLRVSQPAFVLAAIVPFRSHESGDDAPRRVYSRQSRRICAKAIGLEPQMTNRELANDLNNAAGLTGKDAITVNVIRQWVSWGVLPKAAAKGQRIGSAPVWSREGVGSERAVRLADLRKAGIRRETAVIAQSYLDWGASDIESARNAILSEFVKWREQLNRRQTSFLGRKDFRDAGKWKQRAIENQLGQLDRRIVGTPYQQPLELYAIAAEASRTGEADISRIDLLLTDAVARIAPSLAQFVPKAAINAMAKAIPGLTGDPEEILNSGEASIRAATEIQLEEAREITNQMVGAPMSNEAQILLPAIDGNLQKLFELPRQLHSQISIGPWPIFLFVQTLHLQHNVPDLIQEFVGFLGDS